MARKGKPGRNDERFDDEPIYKMGLNNIQLDKLTYKTLKQKQAHKEIVDNDISFMVGSAGTGKSFLPVYCAIDGLLKGEYSNIVLTRPTVEAGETMGFLPGTAEEKIAPFLTPLLDCVEDLIGPELTQDLVKAGIIKFVPIQFLRGRTIKNAFLIVDEAQNADKDQLKLVLTRIGEGTKCVVTADDKQIDIDPKSSCINDFQRFFNVEGIGYCKFSDKDVMRSKAVKLVLSCYDGPVKPLVN
jgi:phosphate starvation-inducible PhoH-like protein